MAIDLLWERSQKVIPGGVNSPVRSFKNVALEPLFIKEASGAYLVDHRDKSYIDYIGSWGALIFGHGYQPIIDAVQSQLHRGTSYGLATALEVELAELLVAKVPSLEMVRLVNSGTEATMSALRLARGFTGRNKIIKFSGCYHGHSNELLVAAGSGAVTHGKPDSAGVTPGVAQDTIVLPYNDLNLVEAIFNECGTEIAAIIVEPVAANMGLILPQEGFLEGLRRITTQSGALLIFDEVITGFRVAQGGAQEYYGVMPDLTCLGKIIGGGFPIGAFGGRKEIMERLSPLGPVYQAGTLSGNPIAVTAGIRILKDLNNSVYERLEYLGAKLRDGLKQIANKTKIPLQITGLGSLTGIFFTDQKVTNFESLQSLELDRYKLFFECSLASGILLPPSPYETVFLSTAFGEEEIERTLSVWEQIFVECF
ncbi:MAG TPA: glutamate-1-semialdehyde 2,1-aminomutase [Bacillota bacterium]|nr:glutamate-1-semialdehyde 2,1-aminomutase [Bacillota bacterium]HOL09721.1 glutamate-1-semialdehyde 2,1-aminomutase [Bacillota bacterium]HPO97310.1 glutamate-1-semialdehyde 2,1-aminomutase [Bacillota bacterium]